METIDIKCAFSKGIRLDFPSDRQLAALVRAWDDGKNHQICFFGKKDAPGFAKAGEYFSMVRSADLVLPESPDQAGDNPETATHSVSVPPKHREYLSYFVPAGPEDGEFPVHSPLGALTTILSALEQLGGSVFLAGDSAAVLRKAETNLKSTFPGVRVVGRAPGAYRKHEAAPIILALQKASPSLIIVGSMADGGELWIPRHMPFTRSAVWFHAESVMGILAGTRRNARRGPEAASTGVRFRL